MFSFARNERAVSANEQQTRALNVLLEAWNTAIDQGIDAEVVSKTAIFAGLSDMVGVYGERAVADMTEDLPQRIRQGDFSVRD